MALELFTQSLSSIDHDDLSKYSVQAEDLEKARSIGVLTPRSTCPDDYVPRSSKLHSAYVSPSNDTWANRVVSREKATERYTREHSKFMDELDFLVMQDKVETEWEDMCDWIDYVENQEITLTSCPHEFGLCPMVRQQAVRITAEIPKFYFGTTDDNTSVCISKSIFSGLKVHDIYLMDIVFNPVGKNTWAAINVYNKLPIKSMLESVIEFGSYTTYTYTMPCPSTIIGRLVGRDGKNINALLRRLLPGFDEDDYPSVDITPMDDNMARVSVCVEKRTSSSLHPAVMYCTLDPLGLSESIVSSLHL